MSMVENIVDFSVARSMAEAKMQASAKVLKISQDQGQIAADLVAAAMEDLETLISDFAGDLGGSFDAYA